MSKRWNHAILNANQSFGNAICKQEPLNSFGSLAVAMRLASVPLARWAPLLAVLLALLSTKWRQRLQWIQACTDSQMAPQNWHGVYGRDPAPLGEGIYIIIYIYLFVFLHAWYICIFTCIIYSIRCKNIIYIKLKLHNYIIILNQRWLSAHHYFYIGFFRQRNWSWRIDPLEAQVFLLISIGWVVPPPRMPVANEGL